MNSLDSNCKCIISRIIVLHHLKGDIPAKFCAEQQRVVGLIKQSCLKENQTVMIHLGELDSHTFLFHPSDYALGSEFHWQTYFLTALMQLYFTETSLFLLIKMPCDADAAKTEIAEALPLILLFPEIQPHCVVKINAGKATYSCIHASCLLLKNGD